MLLQEIKKNIHFRAIRPKEIEMNKSRPALPSLVQCRFILKTKKQKKNGKAAWTNRKPSEGGETGLCNITALCILH
jgi:hypothetical protein